MKFESSHRMQHRWLHLLRVCLAVGVMACVSPVSADAEHAAFLMDNLQEERVDLMDEVGNGQWTVMMFWSTDCVDCELDKPLLEAFHEKYSDTQASAVGIAIDGKKYKDGIFELIEKHKPSYPNYMAYADVFHRQYRDVTGADFRGTPRYLFFAPDGQLVGTVAGRADYQRIEQMVAGPLQ